MTPMSKSIVYLVGFMGSGKSSVGQHLAELLGWDFVDLDRAIEAGAGLSVRDIFRLRGEDHFRRLEREQLECASLRTMSVVALGGGTFCSGPNRELVSQTGISVWLDVAHEVLLDRALEDGSRPLAVSRESLEELLEKRLPLYSQACLRVVAGNRTAQELAEEIALHVRSLGLID
jgi:shikimate kinase